MGGGWGRMPVWSSAGECVGFETRNTHSNTTATHTTTHTASCTASHTASHTATHTASHTASYTATHTASCVLTKTGYETLLQVVWGQEGGG